MRRCLQCVILVGIVFSPGPVRASTPEQIKADEQALKDAGLKTDGESLLAFFRARTPGERTIEDIHTLINNLGSESFKVRQRATEELIRIGSQAIPPLKEAVNHRDPEVARRVRDCLDTLERSARADMIAAAARVLADRRPDGATRALLDFVAFAEQGYLLDELHDAIATAGCRAGKADDVLRAALADKHPARRAAAAEAMARAGSDDDRKAVRALLKDSETKVRVRAALALVERRDRDAVEVMLDGIPQASNELFWRIEMLLTALGGENGPTVNPGSSEAERQAYQKEWKRWWAANGTKVDLAVLNDARRTRGLTLIVQLETRVPGKAGVLYQGRVCEVGRDGKVRWEIKDLNYPIDAQMVGNDRVLIAEYRSRQVTERNLKGEVVWRKDVPSIVCGVQRLDNGNTLIATRTEVFEVNKAGENVFRHQSPGAMIMGARRLRTGETVLIERTGICQYLDAKGQPRKQMQLGGGALLSVIGTQFDVAPNGNIIVPLYNMNKVVEYTSEGKQVWEHACERPTAVSRLPNGNTLIGSRYHKTLLEVDRAGKKVWEYEAQNGTIMTARRR